MVQLALKISVQSNNRCTGNLLACDKHAQMCKLHLLLSLGFKHLSIKCLTQQYSPENNSCSQFVLEISAFCFSVCGALSQHYLCLMASSVTDWSRYFHFFHVRSACSWSLWYEKYNIRLYSVWNLSSEAYIPSFICSASTFLISSC